MFRSCRRPIVDGKVKLIVVFVEFTLTLRITFNYKKIVSEMVYTVEKRGIAPDAICIVFKLYFCFLTLKLRFDPQDDLES